MRREEYIRGLVDGLTKSAGLILPAWGGESGLTNQGLGLQGGYTYMLGGIPFPYGGIRVGGKKFGLGLTGPIPGISIDMGDTPGWHDSSPRSIWKMLADKIHENRNGRTKRADLGPVADPRGSKTNFIDHDIMASSRGRSLKPAPGTSKPGTGVEEDKSEADNAGNSAGTAFSRGGLGGPPFNWLM